MTFISVDLPDPDGPMMDTISPALISSETPFSAATSTLPMRYIFVTSSRRRTGLPSALI